MLAKEDNDLFEKKRITLEINIFLYLREKTRPCATFLQILKRGNLWNTPHGFYFSEFFPALGERAWVSAVFGRGLKRWGL